MCTGANGCGAHAHARTRHTVTRTSETFSEWVFSRSVFLSFCCYAPSLSSCSQTPISSHLELCGEFFSSSQVVVLNSLQNSQVSGVEQPQELLPEELPFDRRARCVNCEQDKRKQLFQTGYRHFHKCWTLKKLDCLHCFSQFDFWFILFCFLFDRFSPHRRFIFHHCQYGESVLCYIWHRIVAEIIIPQIKVRYLCKCMSHDSFYPLNATTTPTLFHGM